MNQVTKRVDTDTNGWSNWNWRSEGDIMINGAFFVPSGAGSSPEYAQASSVEPKGANYIDQITMNVGVMGDSRYIYFFNFVHSLVFIIYLHECVYVKNIYFCYQMRYFSVGII